MCGLSGFFQPGGFGRKDALEIVRKMANTLIHRGPDDSGEWLDNNAGIALGHRRLSILDLSSTGHQPMVSASGRYVVVFNGEIYNHLEIRKDIEAIEKIGWRGHSDTETLLAGFDHWGLVTTLKKSVGMFAFALWDRKQRVLSLARDRMGEKPLYYGWKSGVFLFGSELKALLKHPAFIPDIDLNALSLYLRYGYIPAPYSIYRDIYKLQPGRFLQITSSDFYREIPDAIPYWSLGSIAQAGLKDPFKGSEEEAVEELATRLYKAVALQRVADVPLGAFLSGGIDSSIIVSMMQEQASQPVKTFTIGFYDRGYDEAAYAEAVADHLGTDHTTFYISNNDVLECIPRINEMYDEPFSDASASMLVSQLARQKVKVSLSGDGGDELFGGYDRYVLLNLIWKNFERIPRIINKSVAMIIYSIPAAVLSALLNPLLSLRGRPPSIPFGQRLHQYASVLKCSDKSAAYGIMMSHGDLRKSLIKNFIKKPENCLSAVHKPEFNDFRNLMLYEDAITYLPGDILVKVDRSAMSVSLETRAPILDHRIVEFSWQLPINMKIRNGEGKWPLREILKKYIPRTLVERPKMGFNLPGAEWLRGPLREWAEDLLAEDRLTKDGYFEVGLIRKMLKQHLDGEYNWQALLWRLLSFQSWASKA